jgi:hypothetical protein
MGSTKARWRGNQLAFYDGTTHETVDAFAPRKQFEDFEGAAIDSNKWLYTDAGAATEALNGTSGAVFTFDATNENQEAGIVNQGNVLAWDISKGLVIEFRAALTVLPTLVAEAHLGVLGESQVDDKQIASADDYAEHACFVFDGSGACVIYTDDGTNDNDAVATGITVLAGAYHTYRIDFTDDADVKFYIDGAAVATSTTFAMDDIASALVQPYVNMTKHDGAGLGTLTLDYIKIWQATR